MQVVGKDNQSSWRLRAFDFLGGTVCAALVGIAAWMAFVHVGEAAQQVAALRTEIESTRHTLTTLEAAAVRQEAQVATRNLELSERGKLPAAAPVDQYLSILSAAAAAHKLTITSHSPGARRRYGDVSELCMAFHVQGTSANLLRFMRDVEESPFWADIGYLRIEGGDAIGPPNTTLRRASFTFSLFAAAPTGAGAASPAEVQP